MSTSPVPLSQINFNPLRVPGTPLAVMVGGSVAGSLLSSMAGNPLATLVSEAISNLQSSIDTINRVLNTPPQLQSLTLNSADIGVLNVASLYGPGQLSVFGGPPSFPLVGWIGNEAAPFQSPTTNITNTVAGLVTTSSAHGLVVNQVVQILGTSNQFQNGFWVVATTPLTTTFTVTGFSGSSTGGTVQRVLVGGWFKTLAVGGTSYLNALTNGLFADENGNLTVNGVTVKGTLTAVTITASTVSASTITGSTVTLNSGNVTTTLGNIVSGSDIIGLKAVNNTFSDCFAQVMCNGSSSGSPPGQFFCGQHGGATATLLPGAVDVIDAAGNNIQFPAGPTFNTATAGAATLPANPHHFLEYSHNGTTYKIPAYSV